jgi:hypothetical protein
MNTIPYQNGGEGAGDVMSWSPQWGGPLELGNGICASPAYGWQDCEWFFSTNNYAPGAVRDTRATYLSGPLTELSSFPNLPKLASLNLPQGGLVVRSLDVQSANGGYSLAFTSSPSVTGFSPSFQHMYISNLQAFAASEGQQSRVVTALSLDSPTTCYVFSYSWANDRGSLYEASVEPVTVGTVGSVAQEMASEGYVLTAFGAGGNPVFGWYLIGTRLQGSTSPRSIFVSSPYSPSYAQYYSQGYVDVVTIYDNPAPGVSTRIWIVEK